MSRRQNTAQILKERLNVLAVILSCIGLVVVTQEAYQLLSVTAQPPKATPVVAPPTPSIEAKPVQSALPTSAPLSSTPVQPRAKLANLSGRWVGSFIETVDGSPQQYLYTLELSQQGTFISGRSTIEKEGDPGTFAKFLVRGQVAPEANTLSVKIVEELFGAQNLHSGSAAAPRNTRLSYFSSEDLEYLEGEWSDRRYASESISGTVKLIREARVE